MTQKSKEELGMVYMPSLPATLRRKNHNVPGHPGHMVSRQSMTLDSKSEGLLVLASAVTTERVWFLFCFNCTKFYQNFKCQISFCFYYGKVWPDFSKKLECEIWIMFLHDYEIILLIQCSALLCSLLFIFFSFLFYCSWLSC